MMTRNNIKTLSRIGKNMLEDFLEKNPDRLPPGHTPSNSYIQLPASKVDVSTLVDAEKLDVLGKIQYKIDIRLNPHVMVRNFYSDGEPVDWNNLEESNRKYRERQVKVPVSELYNAPQ